MLDPQAALAAAAEARRRELPVSIALTILVGGVGAAILDSPYAIAWAALITALLIGDAAIYRQLDQAEAPSPRVAARLALWAGSVSCAYALLPLALALANPGAGLAAAAVLLVAGVVRYCGPGLSGGVRVAIAGAAPLALALLAVPLLLASAGRPDWDAALIAVIGGGALMAYTLQARLGQGRELRASIAALQAEMKSRGAAYLDTMAALSAAREAADAANTSKSHFLTSMSHELRTPLNAIIGYGEILQEEAEAGGRAHELQDIERILSAARQLLHLINGILDLSRVEAGHIDLAFAEIDVGALIEEAIATVRPAAAKNGNRLRLDIEAGLGAAQTDGFKLNQCLLNLLSNAAKFTQDGEILVRARRLRRGEQDLIAIAVSDTGAGLSEAQQSRIFDAFVQADPSVARRFGGSGLGLALTRSLMHALGGEVAVESSAGRGATFTLQLPAYTLAPRTPARLEPGAAPAHGLSRTVLLIDDDASARDLAARSLARVGFEVAAAPTGEAGIARATSLQPSLIVLDLNLPGMSGWEVLQALKDPATRAIPVIVHSVEDARGRAIAAGACEHLTKPADRDVLAAAALRFATAPAAAARAQPQMRKAAQG
jgi:signal transduction histidine kinase/ActR/RegA family two-component response regulator